MGEVIGQQTILGMTKGSTYRTSVAMSASGDYIPFLSENFTDDIVQLPRESLEGKQGIREIDHGETTVSGAVEADLSYDKKSGNFHTGTDLLIAMAMGTCTFNNSYSLYTLPDNLTVFANFGVRRTSTVCFEIISAMCRSMELSGVVGEPCKISTEWLAWKMLRLGTTITSAHIDASQPAEAAPRVLFNDLSFRLSTDFTDALAAIDAITINGFSLTLDNNLTDATFGTAKSTGHTDANLTLQPVRNGVRTVTLELTLPRHDDNANYFPPWIAGTAMQGELIFTGPESESIHIFLPWLQVVSTPEANIGGPEALEEKVVLQAMRGEDYNNGAGNIVMLNNHTTPVVITEELEIDTTNDRTVSPLA